MRRRPSRADGSIVFTELMLNYGIMRLFYGCFPKTIYLCTNVRLTWEIQVLGAKVGTVQEERLASSRSSPRSRTRGDRKTILDLPIRIKASK